MLNRYHIEDYDQQQQQQQMSDELDDSRRIYIALV